MVERAISCYPARPARDSSNELPNIGLRLRYERRARRLRLRDLAAAAGCSESLLSRVENNLVTPSLPTLHRLCNVLELSVHELLSPPKATSCIVYRAGERPQYSGSEPVEGDKTMAESLVPFGEGRMLEAHIWHVPANDNWCGPFQHVGEEAGFILAGALELRVNDDVFILHAGDSFFFKSDQRHSYNCYGDQDCSIVWVNTPPTF